MAQSELRLTKVSGQAVHIASFESGGFFPRSRNFDDWEFCEQQ